MAVHPLPIITDGFKVENLYHSDDATFANIYWLQYNAATTPADVGADFITAYDTGATTPTLKALHSSSVTFDGVNVTALDGVTPTEFVARGAGVAGGGAALCASANAAMVITLLTGQRGRARRGRLFLGGCPASSMHDGGGLWSTALVADAQSWYSNFYDNLINTGYQPLMVSQRSEEIPGDHFYPITAWTARQGVGTQRGRTERNKP